jgi:hypothetical protein
MVKSSTAIIKLPVQNAIINIYKNLEESATTYIEFWLSKLALPTQIRLHISLKYNGKCIPISGWGCILKTAMLGMLGGNITSYVLSTEMREKKDWVLLKKFPT